MRSSSGRLHGQRRDRRRRPLGDARRRRRAGRRGGRASRRARGRWPDLEGRRRELRRIRAATRTPRRPRRASGEGTLAPAGRISAIRLRIDGILFESMQLCARRRPRRSTAGDQDHGEPRTSPPGDDPQRRRTDESEADEARVAPRLEDRGGTARRSCRGQGARHAIDQRAARGPRVRRHASRCAHAAWTPSCRSRPRPPPCATCSSAGCRQIPARPEPIAPPTEPTSPADRAPRTLLTRKTSRQSFASALLLFRCSADPRTRTTCWRAA